MSRYSNKKLDAAGDATRNIHCGVSPDPLTGAILPPIYQTATYAQEAVGVNKGHTYSRSSNPTVSMLESKIASVEHANHAIAYATGLAATTALFMALLSSRDHIVCSDVIFGGTTRLLDKVFSKYGVDVTYVDSSDIKSVEDAITSKTKLFFIETPANPTMRLTDIKAVCDIARENNILTCIDNTFLTGMLQRPLELGADIVLYSTTKYIDGHNATVGGALVTNSAELLEEFNFIRKSTGNIQSPMNAWLIMQGLKTLDLRMKQHSKNAEEVIEYLENHPRVTKINYPGFYKFAQYKLANEQHYKGLHGGMLSFEVVGGYEEAYKIMNSVCLCTLAESLGATESLITHPSSMTHVGMTVEQRAKFGIADGLIRLSVGLEDPKDIIADLEQAFKK